MTPDQPTDQLPALPEGYSRFNPSISDHLGDEILYRGKTFGSWVNWEKEWALTDYSLEQYVFARPKSPAPSEALACPEWRMCAVGEILEEGDELWSITRETWIPVAMPPHELVNPLSKVRTRRRATPPTPSGTEAQVCADIAARQQKGGFHFDERLGRSPRPIGGRGRRWAVSCQLCQNHTNAEWRKQGFKWCEECMRSFMEPDPTPATGAGESATPETDALAFPVGRMHPSTVVVAVNDARRLETQRNAAIVRAEAAEREVAELKLKKKQACEALDAIGHVPNPEFPMGQSVREAILECVPASRLEAAQADLAKAREEAAGLRTEVETLTEWKRQAMIVMPDFQEIGKLLGVGWGQSVHDKIIPGIEKLIRERNSYRSRYYSALSGEEE